MVKFYHDALCKEREKEKEREREREREREWWEEGGDKENGVKVRREEK